MKVLSIDFDVFIDTTRFIPGNGSFLGINWACVYNTMSDGVGSELRFQQEAYEETRKFLATVRQPVYVAEDHHSILEIIAEGEDIHITNLDYHSNFWSGTLDCGSWISYLIQGRNQSVFVDWRQLHWKTADGICYLDSKIDSDIWYTYATNFEGVFDQSYDVIFLCKSGEFSLPHLQHKFRALVESCANPILSKTDPPKYRRYTDDLEECKHSIYCKIVGRDTITEADEDNDDLYLIHSDPEFVLEGIVDCCSLYKS